MPLEKGKEAIGRNIKTEEKTKSPAQAKAIALSEAGVPKAKDNAATAPNSGIPEVSRSRSADDAWKGKRY